MPDSGGEFELIAKIRNGIAASPRVPLGVGDDCAVVATGGATLVAADMLLEGRHFTIDSATPGVIGRKALAVNLSDMAAMAGRPVAAFVSVAHRRELGFEFAAELHVGLAELAGEFGVAVAGGDTNVWDGPLVVGVTLLGDIVGERAITRDAAVADDIVFVTGPLGGSLRAGRHLSFVPRVNEALRLHAAAELHAMIDISDGLLADLGHICEESGVAAVLNAEAIPIHEDVEPAASSRERLRAALSDGEDFELAFCVSAEEAERLRECPPDGVSLFEVGKIVAGDGVLVLEEDGTTIEFPARGWVHRW